MARVNGVIPTPLGGNRATRETLRQAFEDLSQRYTDLVNKHNSLQQNIVDQATEAAEREGWCSEFQDLVRDLGMGEFLPSTKRTVRIEFDVEVEADTISDAQDEDHLIMLARSVLSNSANTYPYNTPEPRNAEVID